MITKYRNKISGPLLDRIDIHVEVPAVKYKEMAGEATGEMSEKIRARVEAARAIQRERFGQDQCADGAEGDQGILPSSTTNASSC